MPRFAANYVLTLEGDPIPDGIVETDNNGMIVQTIAHNGDAKELRSTEYHNGIIVPGFVNTHCHTELSNLKGKLIKGGGLAKFVEGVRASRNDSNPDPIKAVAQSIAEMANEGTVAAIDICNSTLSFASKAQSRVRFYNLIEVLGLDPARAEDIISYARIVQEIVAKDFTTSITPHSCYSLSTKLWGFTKQEIASSPLISIHYAESRDEALLTEKAKGKLARTFESWGLPVEQCPRMAPLRIIKEYLPSSARILFVHNTFLDPQEAEAIKLYFPNSFFTICPESNLNIEGAVPDIPMLMQKSSRITIGTDSLASASSLSMLKQLRIIQMHFPSIPFQTMLKWATFNGANAIGLLDEIGSIKVGKTPGLILIQPFDFVNFKLLPQSRARVLA